MSFIGRAIVSVNVAWVYIYSAELYPTVIRNCGVGFCTSSGRVGAMIGQQLYKLAIYHAWLPAVIVGCIGVLAGFCRYVTNSKISLHILTIRNILHDLLFSLSLPETIDAPLFQTLDEAETFYEQSALATVNRKTACE